jgi:hypothetical protein
VSAAQAEDGALIGTNTATSGARETFVGGTTDTIAIHGGGSQTGGAGGIDEAPTPPGTQLDEPGAAIFGGGAEVVGTEAAVNMIVAAGGLPEAEMTYASGKEADVAGTSSSVEIAENDGEGSALPVVEAGGTIVGTQVESSFDAEQVVGGLAQPGDGLVEPTNAEIAGAATASSAGESVTSGGAAIIVPSSS